MTWKTVTFADVTEKAKQRDPRKSPNELFQYIDVSSVSNESFTIQETQKLEGKNAPSRARKVVTEGDIIFATVRPTLKRVARIPKEYDNQICSTGYCVLKPRKDLLHSWFAYYYLLSEKVRDYVFAREKGATYPAIRDSDLFQLEIPLPSLTEQQTIAKVLRTVQEAIEVRRKELALERERKAALMEHLFTHGTRGEPSKQTEIGEVPESWQLERLESQIEKPQYGYTDSAQDKNTGLRLLRITDIQEQGVDWENVPFSSCPSELRNKYLLKKGDIVIARIGATTGKAHYVEECPDAVFASYLIRVRAKPTFTALFLCYFLQTKQYWSHIDAHKGGRLKGGVNLPIINSMKLPVPPKREQETIASVLYSCDGKIKALQNEIRLHVELFNALLEKLMSGEISTQPLLAEKAA